MAQRATNGAQALFNANSPLEMVAGWLLGPLTDKFAFISPSKPIVVTPLLALFPLALLWLTTRHAFVAYRCGSAE